MLLLGLNPHNKLFSLNYCDLLLHECHNNRWYIRLDFRLGLMLQFIGGQ